MNKNELELKKAYISANKFTTVLQLLQHTITMLSMLTAVGIIMAGLVNMVKANPDSLVALSHVVEKIKLDSILAWLVAAGTSMGWVYERRGKKRAYSQLGEARAKIEKSDPYHPSSQLDSHGHAPKTQ